jgi:addiction module RelE/StbE family toxin
MVQKIIWTAQAHKDLKEIKDYIALDSLYYAERMIYLIFQSCKKLRLHPEIGMFLSEEDGFKLRRILIKRYRVIYTEHNSNIYIIAVYHQARLLPAKFDIMNNLFE